MNHRELVLITSTVERSIEWLRSRRSIPDTMICTKCPGHVMQIVVDRDKEKFKCSKCAASKSIYFGTILYNINKDIREILDIIYFWSIDLLQLQTRIEIKTKSRQTTCVWYKKLSILSYHIMKDIRPAKIGGVGHVVEIDESMFSKRKYNVGRAVRSLWVVGGIDLMTDDTFFVEVTHRSREVLRRIILENVELGTTICTDEWAGYINLEEIGYHHLTVNHSRYFVDPDTGANTQRIENSWCVFKKKIRSRGLTNTMDFTLFFAEFLFKKKFEEEFLRLFLIICQILYLE